MAFQQMEEQMQKGLLGGLWSGPARAPLPSHSGGIKPHATQKVEAFIMEKAAKAHTWPASAAVAR